MKNITQIQIKKTELDAFISYFFEFYSVSGLYPNCHGKRCIDSNDVAYAVGQMVAQGHDWGGGDSVDRERALFVLTGLVA